MTVYTRTYAAPPVNRGEILRYAGVRGRAEDVEKLLDECLEETGGLTYRVCYAEFPIIRGEELDLGFIKTRSDTAKKALLGCDSVVVFGATVGLAIDRLIAKYSVLSPAKALLLQAIGAERIESLCDLFCSETAVSKSIRPRFSAGYGDLPLEVQRDIFAVLGCEKNIGVTLNESLLMSPTKSVTAMFGVKNENT